MTNPHSDEAVFVLVDRPKARSHRADAEKLAQGMLLHGLEFVADAVQRLSSADATSLNMRFAVVHLATGAELLLKARLTQEHWALLFEKTDDASFVKLKAGTFKSVSAEVAIERLERLGGVQLEHRAKQGLKELRELRNQIVHIGVLTTPDALRVRAARALSEFVDFIDDEFAANDDAEALRDDIKTGLKEFKEYAQKRRDVIRDSVKALGDRVFYCPRCSERAVELTLRMRAHCLYCRESFLASDLLESHVERTLGGSMNETTHFGADVGDCPKCEGWLVRARPGAEGMVCLDCRFDCERSRLDFCECGRWVLLADDGSRAACRYCVEAGD